MDITNVIHNLMQFARKYLPVFIFGGLVFLLMMDSIKREEVINESINKDRTFTSAKNTESCLHCHSGMSGFSPSHDPEAIGCSSCHLGNPTSLNKEESHKGMVLIPGNLQNSWLTCGKCHDKIEKDIHHSLMATGRGIVTVNRYVFSEAKTPEGKGHLSELSSKAASEKHARQLCATCHLNYEKKETGAITQRSRGGGCNACHLKYSKEAEKQLKAYNKNTDNLPRVHPSLSQQADDTHCFGCHSRSGRISTSYEGWHETMKKTIPTKNAKDYRRLEDGRIFQRMPEDVHHSMGLSCIDCHTSTETMGNGINYNHKEQQLEVACEDCHRDDWSNENIQWVQGSHLDETSRRITELRGIYRNNRNFLLSHKKKTAMVNIYKDSDQSQAVMQGKITGRKYTLRNNSKKCQRARVNHENLKCESCHNSWTPQCITCHTSYHSDQKAYDHLKRKPVEGRYIETFGGFLAKKPVLGIIETKEGQSLVSTFSPGMVLTLDVPPQLENFYDGFKKSIFYNKDRNMYELFKRLHAPGFSHTIVKQARSCESCHWSSHAIGWGEGTLSIPDSMPADKKPDEFIRNSVSFNSYYIHHKVDHLPLDAWIAPFEKTRGIRDVSTRSNARPFSPEEQLKVLRVGYCMQCHNPHEASNADLFQHYAKSLKYYHKCQGKKNR